MADFELLAFSDDSQLRRFSVRCPSMLGGATAILLQIAHPAVAAGVDQHSDFRTSTVPRLFNTMDLIFTILYGTPEQAAAIAKRVHAVHAKVNGHVAETGDSYDARDRRTQTWVWATLVHVSMDIHDRFVWVLSSDEKDAIYADWVKFALIFGIGEEHLPATIGDFEEYVAQMIATELQVTDTARKLAEFIVSPWKAKPWWVPFPKTMQRSSELVTIGLLPPDLQKDYGFELNSAGWEKMQAALLKAYGKGLSAEKPKKASLLPTKPLVRLARSTSYYGPRAYVTAKRWKESVTNTWPMSRL